MTSNPLLNMVEALGLIKNEAERVGAVICAEYCKFPDQYYSKYADLDEAAERLGIEKCDSCPLAGLGVWNDD